MYGARLTSAHYLGRYGSISDSIIHYPITVLGRARRSAKNLRQLVRCTPPTVRSSSRRGIATDAISAENLYAFGVKHVTKGLGRITEGIMTKGEGSYVVYDDGRRMLDFTCGIGVTSLGKLYFPRRMVSCLGLPGSGGFFYFKSCHCWTTVFARLLLIQAVLTV